MRKSAFDLNAIRNKRAHMDSTNIEDTLNIGFLWTCDRRILFKSQILLLVDIRIR
jgi:hypothetical protein